MEGKKTIEETYADVIIHGGPYVLYPSEFHGPKPVRSAKRFKVRWSVPLQLQQMFREGTYVLSLESRSQLRMDWRGNNPGISTVDRVPQSTVANTLRELSRHIVRSGCEGSVMMRNADVPCGLTTDALSTLGSRFVMRKTWNPDAGGGLPLPAYELIVGRAPKMEGEGAGPWPGCQGDCPVGIFPAFQP